VTMALPLAADRAGDQYADGSEPRSVAPTPTGGLAVPTIRRARDLAIWFGMAAACAIAGLLVVAVALVLLVKAHPLLARVPISQVLLSDVWRPSGGQFGLRPFIWGTAWVTGLAVALAAPPSLLAAVYLAEYASPTVRAVTKSALDVMAGLPSVTYGMWGLLVVVPFVGSVAIPFLAKHCGGLPAHSGRYAAGYCVLSGGLVLATMLCPTIISVSHEVLQTVSAHCREASLALGATRLETVRSVVVRTALPGLLAAIALAVARALGETIAVLLVVGNVPSVPRSVVDPAYPLPALIANNYGEVMSVPLYESALMLAALVLLGLALLFAVSARIVLLCTTRRVAG